MRNVPKVPAPLPERHVYVASAKKKRPTRSVLDLTHDEVRQARAMARSGAVGFTIAAHFGIPHTGIGRLLNPPFRLRAEVPRPFETEAEARYREGWFEDEVRTARNEAFKEEVNRAHAVALREEQARHREQKNEVNLAHAEALREHRERRRVARKPEKASAARDNRQDGPGWTLPGAQHGGR